MSLDGSMSLVAAASAAARMDSADGALAYQRLRRLFGQHRPVAHAEQRDARLRAAALVVELDSRGHADQREIAVPPRNLLEGKAAPSCRRRNANLRQKLARLDGRREQADEKVLRSDLARPR